MIVIDEWAFFTHNKEILKEMVPIYRVRHRALIGISSPPKDPLCMFARACATPEFGPIVIVHVCESCQAKGVMNVCPHRQVAKWMSSDKDEDIEKLLGAEDAKEERAREALGYSLRDQEDRKAFPERKVLELFGPRTQLLSSERFVYVAIDTARGSDRKALKNQSDVAMVAMTNNQLLVVDSFNAAKGSSAIVRFIVGHLEQLRTKTWLQRCIFVIGVEGNLGQDASMVEEGILRQKVDNVIFIQDYDQLRGVDMNAKSKTAMKDMVYNLLMTNSISINDECQGPPAQLEMLKQQMLNYMHMSKFETLPSGAKIERTVLSGKLTSATKDDLCIALQWVFYIKYKFRNEAKYDRQRNSVYVLSHK